MACLGAQGARCAARAKSLARSTHSTAAMERLFSRALNDLCFRERDTFCITPLPPSAEIPFGQATALRRLQKFLLGRQKNPPLADLASG